MSNADNNAIKLRDDRFSANGNDAYDYHGLHAASQKGGFGQSFVRSFFLPKTLAFILMLAFISWMLSSFYMPLDPKSKNCLRPGVYISFSSDGNSLPVESYTSKISRYLSAYPNVFFRHDGEICRGSVDYRLEFSKTRNKDKVHLGAKVFPYDARTNQQGEKPIWTWKKTIFGENNDAEVELNLMMIVSELGSNQSPLVDNALSSQWQNKKAYNNYKCTILGYRNFHPEDDKSMDNYYQCLKKQIDEGTPFADVYGRYAHIMHYAVLGYARFDGVNYTEEFDKSVWIAQDMDPNDFFSINALLQYYRYQKSPNYGAVRHLLKRINQQLQHHPEALLEYAKLNGLYLGKWDEAKSKIRLYHAISPHALFSYAEMGSYMMDERWGDALNAYSSHEFYHNAPDGLALIRIGGELQRKDIIAKGVEILDRYDIHNKDEAIAYAESLNFHFAFRNRLEAGVKKYYP